MATTVTLQEYQGPRTVRLDARQTAMFLRELHRVGGGPLRRLFTFGRSASAPAHPVAPDCTITVDRDGSVTEYELLGRFVLRENGGSTHQFYMGLLLLEWLFQ